MVGRVKGKVMAEGSGFQKKAVVMDGILEEPVGGLWGKSTKSDHNKKIK